MEEAIKENFDFHPGELLVIESMEEIRKNKDDAEILIKCKGLKKGEPDWVTVESLPEDVPELLSEFFNSVETDGSARQRKIDRYIIAKKLK